MRNVGGAALESILEERKKNGPYTSLGEFCSRIDSSRVNRKVIESLVKAGAFDSMGGKRAQFMAILDIALDRAKAIQRDRLSGQMSLFSLGKSNTAATPMDIELPEIEEWPELAKLGYEKDTLGFFLTGHPLERIIEGIKTVADSDIDGLDSWHDGQAVRVGGLIQNYKEHKSKKGDLMAFAVLEDMISNVEVIVFPSTFEQCSYLLGTDQPVIVLGTIQEGERGVKIIAESIHPLQEALEKYTQEAVITVNAEHTSRHHFEQIKNLLYQHHGTCPIKLTLHFDGRGEVDVEILRDLTIKPNMDFSNQVAEILGYKSIGYRMSPPEIKRRFQNGKNKYRTAAGT